MVTQLAEILVVLKMNPEITAEQHAAALRILQETTVRKAPARFDGVQRRQRRRSDT